MDASEGAVLWRQFLVEITQADAELRRTCNEWWATARPA
jgi:hypothetical protein